MYLHLQIPRVRRRLVTVKRSFDYGAYRGKNGEIRIESVKRNEDGNGERGENEEKVERESISRASGTRIGGQKKVA